MHGHGPEEAQKDLDIMRAKINALEAASRDEHQRGTVKVLRALLEQQAHTMNEFEHLKKAIDLLTLELFKTRNASG